MPTDGIYLRRLAGLLPALAVAALLAGPAAAEQQNACHGGFLNIGYVADAVGLDPHLTTAQNSELMFQFAYSGLLKIDDKMQILPDIATSWQVSEDGLTYTFDLRDNVKFHNGRLMTADDVIYSLQRIIDAGTPFSARLDNIASMRAVGNDVVEIVLKERFAPFLSVLATVKAAIVPREEVEKHGDLQNVMVGTGPYKFVEYKPGTSLRLEKNPDYYDPDLPYLDGLEIKVIPDEVTRVAALRSGQIDFAALGDPLSLRIIESDSSAKTLTVPMLQRNVLVLNVNQAPLDDVRVRQAIAVAVDRQEVVDLGLGGFGQVSGPFPDGLAAWALPRSEIPFYDEAPNLEKAKALLAEAGYPDGFTLQTYAAPQYASHIPVAEVLQQQLARIGIKMDIQVIEWGVLLKNWSSNNFASISMTYAGRSDPYYYTYERLHSKSPGNASRLADAEIDRLSEEGMELTSPEERKAVYDKLQVRMAETSAIIYLATTSEFFAMRKSVEGFKGMPDSSRGYLANVWLNTACN